MYKQISFRIDQHRNKDFNHDLDDLTYYHNYKLYKNNKNTNNHANDTIRARERRCCESSVCRRPDPPPPQALSRRRPARASAGTCCLLCGASGLGAQPLVLLRFCQRCLFVGCLFACLVQKIGPKQVPQVEFQVVLVCYFVNQWL